MSKISIKKFLFRTLLFTTLFSIIIAIPNLFINSGVVIISFNIYNFNLRITEQGLFSTLQFILRVWVCVSSLILLNLTTKFSSIINTMESFKFPKVFIMIITVTYRFIFLFVNEAYQMILAKEARSIRKISKIENIKILGFMISSLFIRAYEKGEKVYLAMKNRGYSGEMKNLSMINFHFKDAIFIFSFLMFIVFSFFIGGFIKI
jgi:cobalt/nickel transport system permease protein